MEIIRLERKPVWDVLINGEIICPGVLAETEQEALEQCEKYNSAFAREYWNHVQNGRSVTTSVVPHK